MVLKITQRNSTNCFATITGLELYPNGVISTGNKANNKVLTSFDGGASDAVGSATNFYGFGVNTASLRYQCQAGANHKFWVGAATGFTITSTGGSPVSDIRLKRNRGLW